jgi:hypothetical protein
MNNVLENTTKEAVMAFYVINPESACRDSRKP